MDSIKLYRGLKGGLKFVDQETVARHAGVWRQILAHRRESADYPAHLNEAIIRLHKEARLRRQAFSDRRETAERYAGGGTLIELEVPVDDVLRHFELEIQNYDKRKRRFEIVYTIASRRLAECLEAWNCKITPL